MFTHPQEAQITDMQLYFYGTYVKVTFYQYCQVSHDTEDKN